MFLDLGKVEMVQTAAHYRIRLGLRKAGLTASQPASQSCILNTFDGENSQSRSHKGIQSVYKCLRTSRG